MSPKITNYKKYLPYLKDLVYIVGIVVSLLGWIRAKTENKTLLETTVKYNTEAVKKLDAFVTKQVDLNTKQAEINGALLEFKNKHSE